MKNNFLICFFICFSFFVFSEDEKEVDSVKILRFVSDPWEPFTYGNTDGSESQEGLAYDIVSVICYKLGYRITMNIYPWRRCVARVKNGKSDGIPLISINSARKKYLKFTDKIMDGRDIIVYRSDISESFSWNKWEDLKKFRIGITAGFSYGDEWQAACEKYNFELDEAVSPEMTMVKLLNKRFDIALFGEGNYIGLLNSHPEFRGKFSIAEKPVQSFRYYIAFSKFIDDAVVESFNCVIKELLENGKINLICKKWGF